MTLIAAVDDSDRAAVILEETIALADDLDEDVHVVHILERSEFVDVVEKDVHGQDLTENYEVRQIVENIVGRVTEPSNTLTTAIRVGDPAAEIVRYVTGIDARYVVIGGRQRSPTGKALFGSVAQQVIFRSPIPVLTVALDAK